MAMSSFSPYRRIFSSSQYRYHPLPVTQLYRPRRASLWWSYYPHPAVTSFCRHRRASPWCSFYQHPPVTSFCRHRRASLWWSYYPHPAVTSFCRHRRASLWWWWTRTRDSAGCSTRVRGVFRGWSVPTTRRRTSCRGQPTWVERQKVWRSPSGM